MFFQAVKIENSLEYAFLFCFIVLFILRPRMLFLNRILALNIWTRLS